LAGDSGVNHLSLNYLMIEELIILTLYQVVASSETIQREHHIQNDFDRKRNAKVAL
jgi:hypothetical protein